MNVLHVASEVAPWSKTGGLGDVASALPRALAGAGAAADDHFAVVTPAYQVDAARYGLARRLRKVRVSVGGYDHEVGVLEGRVMGGGGMVHAWLVDHESFRRPALYGEGGADYPDNAFRFALFSRAALAVPRAFGFTPDVIHAHDWQAGPSLVYARNGELPSARAVFTIHNLAFQGLFAPEVAAVVDLGGAGFSPEGHEFYGRLSYLKAGLAVADRITTVSPRYAREILAEEFGFGMDGYLQSRAERLSGVLNGCDYDQWNPARDPACAVPYSAEDPSGKRACKAALQRALGLVVRPRAPLIGAVSRLSWQKGFDYAAGALEALCTDREVQVVILGSGERELEQRLQALAARFPGRVAVRIGYDEELSHRIYAGSDLFLMPSRYEPCGLGQMYALRYGAAPVVRTTGGLDDTVVDFDARSHSGTGFKFVAPTAGRARWRAAPGAGGLQRRAGVRDPDAAGDAAGLLLEQLRPCLPRHLPLVAAAQLRNLDGRAPAMNQSRSLWRGANRSPASGGRRSRPPRRPAHRAPPPGRRR